MKVFNEFEKIDDIKYEDIVEYRQKNNFGISKDGYKENWDYWNRV
jgi:hypothetical protein